MGLPRIIKSLLKKGAYMEAPGSVTLLQTHISYLFMTPLFVYKIKKPVNFGFLDFTTLKKRLYFCREEVRLNKRLAPGVYIGVVPVTKQKNAFRMEGKGAAVEYAVKMRRLKQENMLDFMIKNEVIAPSVIKKVARAISGFHKKAGSSPAISKFGNLKVVRKNTEENFAQVLPFIGKTISDFRYREIRGYTGDFIVKNAGLFKERQKKGFIRDCHGDIHSEHISVTDGINIFDCIEFNRRFRYCDTVSDAAFLSMDLDFRGRGDLSRVYDRAYFSSSPDRKGDRKGRALLNFYKCYRAFVKGKVESFRLVEPEETEEDKKNAFLNAIRFFHLSHLYARGGYRPALIVVCGLVGTGKSTLSGALKDKTGMCLLSSDIVRKRIFSIPEGRHIYERFGRGIYSGGATERTYAALLREGQRLLESGRSVILDAAFSNRRYLEGAKKAAEKCGAFFFVIECGASGDTVKKRLRKRSMEKGAVSDATWEIYKKQKVSFERIISPDMTAYTENPPEILSGEAVKKLFTERPRQSIK